jgi:dihydroorotate dehydrogenase (fumarate)
MDLSVEYLGLKLAHPAPPAAALAAGHELGTVRALEDAGAPAIVMRSLFEEQLTQEQLSTFMATEVTRASRRRPRACFRSRPTTAGPGPYLEHCGRSARR